jgi:phosphoribosylformimino-5-aminoimidazole carboxamide ribotide isomerase
MRFRPCIDIHNGKVKQIVGGSLTDDGRGTAENFVSDKDAAYYAGIYAKYSLAGGHIAMLNANGTKEYEATRAEAIKALKAYPGGLMIGGGVTPDNAKTLLEMGASHVIVTSYVFKDGCIRFDRLNELVNVVGREHLVLDLSCRKRDGRYYIVTDRWQKFTDCELNRETLDELSQYCSEYLIHAVDVEGKASGIETDLASLLGSWHVLPVTYAGGVSSEDDLRLLRRLGQGHLDVTVGSALDLFGGTIPFETVLALTR